MRVSDTRALFWPQLFYRVHIFGFLVLLIFANMHYNRVWAWAFPGAALKPR